MKYQMCVMMNCFGADAYALRENNGSEIYRLTTFLKRVKLWALGD